MLTGMSVQSTSIIRRMSFNASIRSAEIAFSFSRALIVVTTNECK